jgi:hypothetical protein
MAERQQAQAVQREFLGLLEGVLACLDASHLDQACVGIERTDGLRGFGAVREAALHTVRAQWASQVAAWPALAQRVQSRP